MKLSWGCGPDVRAGWVNSDRDDHGQDHVGDITDGLPWPDETFDLVVSVHALQMVDYPRLVPALTELRRVLRPDGLLRLVVPDLLAAFHAWQLGERSHFVVADELEPHLDGKLCLYVTQGGSTRSVFTASWLEELLARAGFAKVVDASFDVTNGPWPDATELDSRADESLFVEAWR